MKQQPGALGRNALPAAVPVLATPTAPTAPCGPAQAAIPAQVPVPAQGPPGTAFRTFPGTPAHVSTARRYVTQFLADPGYRHVIDDAVLLVSELASNAILHTRSGDPLGGFTVELGFSADTVRIAVHDQGSREVPRVLHGNGEGGRGLGLVEVLAADWGITGGPAGRTVWFALTLRP
ncbi:ATP-binding protein [Streptomyces sp. RKAG337]|uniref:ATP-binding protein n=1 Tax=Streptomyces sp. RKAG337 TaxID=2893404 RepID=UPI00203476AD|nr:ATP-binding protein [Streptomyces sp. RKAG337]MCM2426422.1 ATP-binding protein [Streptomyces sp. RKAG337]